EKYIQDAAGIRVICSYIDDIYGIADALLEQDDITLITRKDYIVQPKPNGYRSLHLIVEVPVFFAKFKKSMKVEVQIRTIAMDFWASLEHQLKYKQNIPNQQAIVKQLRECADVISMTDQKMIGIRQQIEAVSDAPTEEEILLEKLSRMDMNVG
ncbi:MAG: GTP pyrophosphokinase family protein, partial [Eubacterium sp.]|nr:GTP pyrophosphokinase family protein [Eubacterium sp.]